MRRIPRGVAAPSQPRDQFVVPSEITRALDARDQWRLRVLRDEGLRMGDRIGATGDAEGDAARGVALLRQRAVGELLRVLVENGERRLAVALGERPLRLGEQRELLGELVRRRRGGD